jgi:hypothetical protein
MEMKIDFQKAEFQFWAILLAICSSATEITTKFQKIEKMVKNQPTIDAFMDRRLSSEYHFLSNDVVNFRVQRWVECACIRWERQGISLPRSVEGRAVSTFVKISIEEQF